MGTQSTWERSPGSTPLSRTGNHEGPLGDLVSGSGPFCTI